MPAETLDQLKDACMIFCTCTQTGAEAQKPVQQIGAKRLKTWILHEGVDAHRAPVNFKVSSVRIEVNFEEALGLSKVTPNHQQPTSCMPGICRGSHTPRKESAS